MCKTVDMAMSFRLTASTKLIFFFFFCVWQIVISIIIQAISEILVFSLAGNGVTSRYFPHFIRMIYKKSPIKLRTFKCKVQIPAKTKVKKIQDGENIRVHAYFNLWTLMLPSGYHHRKNSPNCSKENLLLSKPWSKKGTELKWLLYSNTARWRK